MPTDLLAPAAGIGWLTGMVGIDSRSGARWLVYDGSGGVLCCQGLPNGYSALGPDAISLRPDESHPGTLALVVSQCWPAVEAARWAASDAEQFSLPPIPEAAAVAAAWLAVCDAVCDHHQCSPEHIAAVRALVAAVVDWRAR